MLQYEDEYICIKEENEVLICSYQPDTIIDKKVSDIMIQHRINHSKERDRLVVMDGRNVKYWTFSSRNSSMKELGFKYISKSCLILPSNSLLVVWKFISKILPPPIEIKVFTDYDKGVDWLLSK